MLHGLTSCTQADCLQETLSIKLEESRDEPDQYLYHMADMFAKTERVSQALQKYQSAADSQFLPTLVHSIFAPYLKAYPALERRFIDDQCQAILQRFYDSKGHQKRNVTAGGLGEFKRDLQARLMTVENFGGETFLSEEVAINILQELKNAFTRCNLVSFSGAYGLKVRWPIGMKIWFSLFAE